MQFAASSIRQAGVGDLPKNRVTKTQPMIRRHNQALESGKQLGQRLFRRDIGDHMEQ